MMKGENNAIVKLIPSEERLMQITNLCLKFMIKKKEKTKRSKEQQFLEIALSATVEIVPEP